MGGKGKLHLSRFTLIHAHGEEIPVELTAAIIYEGDQEAATVGLFNDLREKLKCEQAMREMLQRISPGRKKWLPWASSPPGSLMRSTIP